jgi:dihydropteroate synthase
VSNKDFVGETLDREQGQRLEGSLAAVVFCIMEGARIVRMHNVRAAVDAVHMTEAMLGWREPAWTMHNLGVDEPVWASVRAGSAVVGGTGE